MTIRVTCIVLTALFSVIDRIAGWYGLEDVVVRDKWGDDRRAGG